MNHQHSGDRRQQFGGPNPFHRSPEEQEQRQPRNSMKRSRGYSPPEFYCPSDPQSTYPAAKRVRRVSGTESFGFPSNNFNNNVNNRGLFLASKSDDEVSLAEEVHIAPTALPNHSIFAQKQQNEQYQQPAQIPSQSQFGHQQVVAAGNTTQFPHRNGPLGGTGASYATDYQPMNNLLGNLHLMRQQRRQNNAQSSQMQAQARQHSSVFPMQQQQQQQQNHYQRHYGNYHSVSKPATTNDGSGNNRSQKKKVSLRVSSNLY